VFTSSSGENVSLFGRCLCVAAKLRWRAGAVGEPAAGRGARRSGSESPVVERAGRGVSLRSGSESPVGERAPPSGSDPPVGELAPRSADLKMPKSVCDISGRIMVLPNQQHQYCNCLYFKHHGRLIVGDIAVVLAYRSSTAGWLRDVSYIR
jgi:hypothetical protein